MQHGSAALAATPLFHKGQHLDAHDAEGVNRWEDEGGVPKCFARGCGALLKATIKTQAKAPAATTKHECVIARELKLVV